MTTAKTKVAVLGGGAGALAAAYELTATPELCDRFEVTVHQLGWRLGGKGASGRNRSCADRIEEHGLHIWFGFYDNGFDLMQRCYAELGRKPPEPLATWREAFHPCDTIVLYESWQGRWIAREFTLPRNSKTPGDAPSPTFWNVVALMLDALEWLRKDCFARAAETHAPRVQAQVAGAHAPLHQARAVAHERQHVEPRRPDLSAHGLVCELLHEFREVVWALTEPNVDDDCLRFLFMTVDLCAATICGVLADGLLERGFGAINDQDLRDWLRAHGASDLTLDGSPILRGFYDLAFGYEGGDVGRPNMAAGASLSAMLRIAFDYKGAILWKMQAGMGDTVFTPLYDVLRERGVKFEFFHWVTGLSPSADGRSVDSIELVEQAQVVGAGYEPLFDVKGLRCWPSEPDLTQLRDRDRLAGVDLEQVINPLGVAPTTLARGKDFDLVVLGIPVGALPPICGKLVSAAAGAKLKAALDNSMTVMTQAFQVWIDRPLADLGWDYADDSAMSSYVEPLDTFCNMTHLLPRENWPARLDVRNISYFCGVLADEAGDTQGKADARAKANAVSYLSDDVTRPWPKAADPDGAFDWDLLVDSANGRGARRFDSQYWRANFQASERYVLTPAGSVKYRLTPGDTGFSNLFAAGDWTRNDIDGGSVEGAVTSGLLAGRAAAGDNTPPLGVTEWFSAKGGGHVGLGDRLFGAAKGIWGAAEGVWGAAEGLLGKGRSHLWPGNGAPPPVPGPPGKGLPEYVEYGALATVPGPLECKGTTLWGFFLKADHERLVKLLRKVFAVPTDGAIDYYPLGSHVMATFGEIERITVETPPFDVMGHVTEPQVALWIPAAAVRRAGDGLLIAESFAMFVPYIWLDNSISLSSGREVFGWSKSFGQTILPRPGEPQVFGVKAFGMDYGKDEEPSFRPLITITEGAAAGEPATQAARFGSLHELGRHFARRLFDGDSRENGNGDWVIPGLHFMESALADLLSEQLPEVFLKQFRDIADGRRAALQQVVRTKMRIQRLDGEPLLNEYDVRIDQVDSQGLDRELGLVSQTTPFAFRVDMDFVVETGGVLWQA